MKRDTSDDERRTEKLIDRTDCPHHFQQDDAADLLRCIYCGRPQGAVQR